MIPAQNTKIPNSINIKDQLLLEKMNLLVQQENNITIPALYLDNLILEGYEFDSNDLKLFFSSLGEVNDVINKGKISIVLYKNFIDAQICKEFLMMENHYKDNSKNNFLVRWFDYEKDLNLLTQDMEIKFEKIHNKNKANIMDNNKNKVLNLIYNGNSNGNKINNGINNKYSNE